MSRVNVNAELNNSYHNKRVYISCSSSNSHFLFVRHSLLNSVLYRKKTTKIRF